MSALLMGDRVLVVQGPRTGAMGRIVGQGAAPRQGGGLDFQVEIEGDGGRTALVWMHSEDLALGIPKTVKSAPRFAIDDKVATRSHFGQQPCVVLAVYPNRSYRVRYEGGLEASVEEHALEPDHEEVRQVLRELDEAAS